MQKPINRNEMQSKIKQQKISMTAADIFAGGGGLTVGLKRAGFQVVAAVENEPNAFSTYKSNHPEVQAFKQDVRTVKGSSLLKWSPVSKIDLLAGCPPCQGFSSLTSKQKKVDPRNELIREMTRLIAEVKPRAVMMENVPGLVTKGKHLFDELLDTLHGMGYIVSWDILQVADFGIPQNRRRFVLLAGKEFCIELPIPTHSWHGRGGLLPWKSLKDVIGGLSEPVTLREAKKKGGPSHFDWHVVRDVTEANLLRLKNTAAGKGRRELPTDLRPDCHKDTDDGFSNVYGRMTWDQVPVTITGGCTTFSKGRFGHPEKDRTISVREAARIQTFPDDYHFDTPYMEYACNIIGNALPCDFAEVVARCCLDSLQKQSPKPDRKR